MSDQFWLDGKVLRKGKEYVGEFAAYEPLLLRELLTDKQAQKAQPPCGADGAVTFALDYYDAGLLGDGGGGNVEWWQDYMRSELSRAHDCYQSQIDANHQPAAPVAPATVSVPDCEWCQDDDVHLPGTWDGACGAKWTFTDGGPKENDVRFCMKCGGHVLLAASQREGGAT